MKRRSILLVCLLFTGCSVQTDTTTGSLKKSFEELSQDDKEAFVAVATESLKFFAGTPDANRETYTAPTVAASGIITALRKNGSLLAEGRAASGATTVETIKQSVEDARRKASVKSVRGLQVQLFILGSGQVLDTWYDHGRHAVQIMIGEQQFTLRNTLPIERNYTFERLQERVCEEVDRDATCFDDDDVTVRYMPVLHIGTQRDGEGFVEWYRGKHRTVFDASIGSKISEANALAKKWLVDNLIDEGQFHYLYMPSRGEYSAGNNMIRQLMASRVLAEMSQSDETLVPLHRKNIDFVLENRYEEDGENGYIVYDNKSKLGAAAMLIRTLVVSPLYDEHEEIVQKAANALLTMQHNSGEFDARYVEPDYEYDEDYLLTFYSWEAILALVELYEKTRDQRILDAARLSQDFYLTRYVDEIDERYYPAYVPRHTMALTKLFALTKDQKYADAVFLLNDKLIDEMLHTDADEPKDLRGRFYNPVFPQYGTPHSASDGVYVEGLAYAYELALLLGDTDHTKKYVDALNLWIYNLLSLQYRDEDTYFMRHPERVIGALRYNVTDNRIRIDTTQHTIDAFNKVQIIFFER